MNLSPIAFEKSNRNYNNILKQNSAPDPQQACESIFIYTCEPVEAVSFKGTGGYNLFKLAGLPALALAGGVAASLLRHISVKSEYEDDRHKIIQNQKDMEYICTLKRDFVPCTEFDEMVLENYNINLRRLEQENKALISKNIDIILSKKKYKDLPLDYPERIKECTYSQSTWTGDKFEITEKTIDSHISRLKKYDENLKKINIELDQESEIPSQKSDNVLSWHNARSFKDYALLLEKLGIKDERIATVPIKDLIKQIKEAQDNETKEEKELLELIEKNSSGEINAKQFFDEIYKLLKLVPEPDANEAFNHEGIIGIIE